VCCALARGHESSTQAAPTENHRHLKATASTGTSSHSRYNTRTRTQNSDRLFQAPTSEAALAPQAKALSRAQSTLLLRPRSKHMCVLMLTIDKCTTRQKESRQVTPRPDARGKKSPWRPGRNSTSHGHFHVLRSTQAPPIRHAEHPHPQLRGGKSTPAPELCGHLESLARLLSYCETTEKWDDSFSKFSWEKVA
jgi:hypothetical protein